MLTAENQVDSKSEYYGNFSTATRLVRNLIYEGFVPAYFLEDNDDVNGIVGFCLLLRPSEHYLQHDNDKNEMSKETGNLALQPPKTKNIALITVNDIYAIVPVREKPVFTSSALDIISLNKIQCKKIRFIHCWDMVPPLYGQSSSSGSVDPTTLIRKDGCSSFISNSPSVRMQVIKVLEKIGIQQTGSTQLFDGFLAVQLWNRFAKDAEINDAKAKMIEDVIISSTKHQAYVYANPDPLPTLKSSPIEWEQYNLEGLECNIANKSYVTYPPLPLIEPNYDTHSQLFKKAKIRLMAVPRKDMQVTDSFEEIIAPLVDAILAKTGDNREKCHKKYLDHILIPVHAFQVPVIQEKFKDTIIIFPEANYVTAYPLKSFRTLAIPEVLNGYTVKLCLNIRHPFKWNVIDPREVGFGSAFCKNDFSKISHDSNILSLQPEVASAYHLHPDNSIAEQCGCIIRESIEYKKNFVDPDEAMIVTGALMEKLQRPDTKETVLTHVWNLDTEEKRIEFIDRYIELLFRAFIPPCRDNGLVFEAHLQNTIARFSRSTGELKGFLIRDCGGIFAHNQTLENTCGIDMESLSNDGFNTFHSIEQVYRKFHFQVLNFHLHTFIRKLNLHHNGHGWRLVRKHFSNLVPLNHPMYRYFVEHDTMPQRITLTPYISTKDECRLPYFTHRSAPNLFLTGLHDDIEEKKKWC